MGYLYVIAHKNAQNMHKIGITKNWDKRRKQLKVGSATYCNTLVEFPDDIEKLVEKQMHAQYKDYRLPQSEWFDLNTNTLYCLKFSLSFAATTNKGEQLYDIEDLSEQEQDEETIALQRLCDWLGNEVHENFYREKYTNNPFLDKFIPDYDYEGEGSVNAFLSFVQPTNKICTLKVFGYYCQKKKDTIMYLMEPSVNWEDGLEKNNWYTDNYGPEEIELDEYLDDLLERLSILTQIDQKLWPSKVWADMKKTEQSLRKYGIVLNE